MFRHLVIFRVLQLSPRARTATRDFRQTPASRCSGHHNLIDDRDAAPAYAMNQAGLERNENISRFMDLKRMAKPQIGRSRAPQRIRVSPIISRFAKSIPFGARRANVTGSGAREPRVEKFGIAKIRRKRQAQRQHGRHPVDVGKMLLVQMRRWGKGGTYLLYGTLPTPRGFGHGRSILARKEL
jgi:hypothetical protein